MNKWKTVLLKPVDSFFFRDHREFTAGETSQANDIFPPRPGTVYGALRSFYIHEHSNFAAFARGEDSAVKEWMGTPDQPGRMVLKGVFLKVDGTIYLPLPHDYLVAKTGTASVAVRLELKKDKPYLAWDNREYRLFSQSSEKSTSPEGYFLPFEKSVELLMDPDQKAEPVHYSSWIAVSDKIGIALEGNSRTARENMLYRIPMKYFKVPNYARSDTGFAAVIKEGPEFKEGVTSFGGRNRPAMLLEQGFTELLNHAQNEELARTIDETGMGRMVFLTPAILNPDKGGFYNRSSQTLKLGSAGQFRVLAVASGRPLLIRGWDIVKNRPKKGYPAYPAGTVFYLEIPRGRALDLIEWLNENNVSDFLDYEGYGWAVLGPTR